MLSEQETQFMKDSLLTTGGKFSRTKQECKQIILISRCSNFHNLTVFDVQKEYDRIENDLQEYYQSL